MKSSPEARRLIRAALKRWGNQREAARRLGLPNHGQLGRMLRGEIRDTPAMLAAIYRARKRAERAFSFVRDEHPPQIDVHQLRSIAKAIGAQVRLLEELARLHDNQEARGL